MLTHVAIATHACGVFNQQTFFAVFLGDDVYYTCNGIRAIERTRRTLHDFDFLDILRVNQRQVILPAHVAMDALAVNQNQDVAVAQAVQLHLGAHVILIKGKRRSETTQDVLDALACIVAQHLAGNHLGLYGRILQQVLRASTRYYHLGQTILPPDVILSIDSRKRA